MADLGCEGETGLSPNGCAEPVLPFAPIAGAPCPGGEPHDAASAVSFKGPILALLLVDLAAWVLLAQSRPHGGIGFCGASLADWAASGGVGPGATPGSPIGPLLLMQAAMMTPLLAQPIGCLWTLGPPQRRAQAIALFVAVYEGVWLIAGLLLTAAADAMDAIPVSKPIVAIALAAAWQIGPARRICLDNCRRLPALSAFGSNALFDCLSFGVASAFWCVGACWALMLPPIAIGGGRLLPMAAVAVLLFAERQAPAMTAGWRLARGAKIFARRLARIRTSGRPGISLDRTGSRAFERNGSLEPKGISSP